MLGANRDALLCDFAETYGIYDLHQLPLKTMATLADGLPEDSRIKMQIAGKKRISPLFAYIDMAHTLSYLYYVLTADKKTQQPYTLKDYMMGKQQIGENKKAVGFGSIDEFEAARQGFING